jgi:uncharacterized protein YecT (DUF1311 family)
MSVRVHRQKVCLTHAQRAWLVRRAEEAGVTISEFLRRIIAAQIKRETTESKP